AALRATALALLGGGLLFLMRWTELRLGRYVPVLFAAACLVDVGSVNSRALAMCTGDSGALFDQSLTARRLQELGEIRPGHFRLASNPGEAIASNPTLDALGAASYRSLLGWELQTLAPNLASLFHIETTYPYLPVIPKRYSDLWEDRAWRTRWSPLFNGRFEVGSLQKPGADLATQHLLPPFHDSHFYPPHLPHPPP